MEHTLKSAPATRREKRLPPGSGWLIAATGSLIIYTAIIAAAL